MSLKLGYTFSEKNNDYAGLHLPEEDRSTHLYVLGSSGVGKSKAIANWVIEGWWHDHKTTKS